MNLQSEYDPHEVENFVEFMMNDFNLDSRTKTNQALHSTNPQRQFSYPVMNGAAVLHQTTAPF
jgi:hypothetical protein